MKHKASEFSDKLNSDSDLQSPAHLDRSILNYAREHAPEKEHSTPWGAALATVSVACIAVLIALQIPPKPEVHSALEKPAATIQSSAYNTREFLEAKSDVSPQLINAQDAEQVIVELEAPSAMQPSIAIAQPQEKILLRKRTVSSMKSFKDENTVSISGLTNESFSVDESIRSNISLMKPTLKEQQSERQLPLAEERKKISTVADVQNSRAAEEVLTQVDASEFSTLPPNRKQAIVEDLLGAKEKTQQQRNKGAAAAPEAAMAARTIRPSAAQSFKAFGHDPDWQLVIDHNGSITFTESGTQWGFAKSQLIVDQSPQTLSYKSAKNGKPLNITINSTPCKDARNFVFYQTKVTVKFGKKLFHGCGMDVPSSQQ